MWRNESEEEEGREVWERRICMSVCGGMGVVEDMVVKFNVLCIVVSVR